MSKPGPTSTATTSSTSSSRRRLERHHAAEPAVAVAASAQHHRRVVHRQRAAGAEHVHQRRHLRPGPEEHQLAGVQIHRRDGERHGEIGETAGRHQLLDRPAQRGRLQQRPRGRARPPARAARARCSGAPTSAMPLQQLVVSRRRWRAPPRSPPPSRSPTYHAGSNPASFTARQAPRCAAVLAPPPLSTTATGRAVTHFASACGEPPPGRSAPAPRRSPAPAGAPAWACPARRWPRTPRGPCGCAAARRCSPARSRPRP